MTAMAFVALGGLFSGCTREIEGGEGNSAAFDIVQNYETAFIDRFGQPAETQTWGFGNSAQTRTGNVVEASTEVGQTFNSALASMSDRLADAIINTGTPQSYFSDYLKYITWWNSGWTDKFYQIHGSVSNSSYTEEYLAQVRETLLREIPEWGDNRSRVSQTGYSIVTTGGPVTLTPIYHNSSSGDLISYYYYPATLDPSIAEIKAMPKYTIANITNPEDCQGTDPANHLLFDHKTYNLVYEEDGVATEDFPAGIKINFIISNTDLSNGSLTLYQSGGRTVEDVTPEPEPEPEPTPEPTPTPTPASDLVPGDQIFKFVLEANKSYYCGEYALGGPYDQYFVRMGNGGQEDWNLARNNNYNDFVSAKADSKAPEGYSAYTAGNGVNGSLTTKGSTVYFLRYVYNNSDGKGRSDDEFMARVGIVINEDTPLYVMELDDKNATTGTAVEDFNGKTYSAKTKEVIEFRIKQSKTYAIYATGSKLGFYGCEVLYENSKRSSARTRGITEIETTTIPNYPEFYGDGRLNTAIHGLEVDQVRWKVREGFEPTTDHVAVFSIGDKNYVGFEDWIDFDYNDVIFEVTGTEGGEEIIEEEENDDPEPVCRIVAEDLTVDENGDFDFNDVVFDVCPSPDENKTILIIRAVGGELPLYIGEFDEDHEVHNVCGLGPMQMTNTGWDGSIKPNKECGRIVLDGQRITSREGAKDITIWVVKKNETITLSAEPGRVPSKICVGTDYKWCRERYDIDDTYNKGGVKLFSEYVAGQLGDDWYKQMDQ